MDEVPEQIHESLSALRPDGLIGFDPPKQSAPTYPQLEEAVPRELKQPVAPGSVCCPCLGDDASRIEHQKQENHSTNHV